MLKGVLEYRKGTLTMGSSLGIGTDLDKWLSNLAEMRPTYKQVIASLLAGLLYHTPT